MFPGNINPRQMKQMMRRMGIKSEEIDAETVVIYGSEKKIIIEGPDVVKTKIQGQEMFQISGGDIREENLEGEDSGESKNTVEILKEDIKMVAEQAGVSEEEAKKALEETEGDIAQAIINLKS